MTAVSAMPSAVLPPRRLRARLRGAVAGGVDAVMSCRPVGALGANVDQSEDQGDDDQQVADGGTGSEGGQQVAEPEAVGPSREGGGGVHRSAAGHDPDDVE